MLRKLRPKCISHVPPLFEPLSVPSSYVGPRLLGHFEPLAFHHYRGGRTQVRFYAQQPPSGGGFPGFSLQQQRNKGDTLKEFVGLPSVHRMTADDAEQA